MSVSGGRTPRAPGRRLARRMRGEGGFTMLIVLGVLVVTMLLSAAIFTAVQGEVSLTGANLNAKEAYAAAQAGVQQYLYGLNDNSQSSGWWENCANDSGSGAVPGTTGATYSYSPVPANGNTACVSSNAVASLIDNTTGTLRIESTGRSGNVTRTIVASFKTLSPLSFLWYTVYETKDTSLSGSSSCNQFYWQNPSLASNSNCAIYWTTGDVMDGPMYTQDQFLIDPNNPDPQLGRGPQDIIASQVPTNGTNDICALSNCQGDPDILGTREPDVTPQVPLPSSNANLANDAQAHGTVYTGTVTLTLNGTTASGWNCTSSSASSCTAISVNLQTSPIIYAKNASSGCTTNYSPQSGVTYPSTSEAGGQVAYLGSCGDVYVTGTYTTPLTIGAADDIVVVNNLQTTENASGAPTGSATLGLVANEYVRVYHPCTNGYGNPAVTIDAAILTLSHSFFVDNYGCGGGTLGTLTVHGAIAQYYRGVVALQGSGGYFKNYNYDDRLALILPPYLFDLQNTEWQVFRETLCSTASQSDPTSCQNDSN